MQFRIFGGLAVEHEGSKIELGGPKQRAVLAALLVELARPISPGRLIDLVWGEQLPANPETSLQAYVSNLRRALEPTRKPREPARLLVTQPVGYALLADRDHVDSAHFEDLVTAGRAALQGADARGAVTRLDAALALADGPVLPELAGEPWVNELAVRLDGVRAAALDARVEAGLALGEHQALVPLLERAVSEHPFRERLRAQLALALYRCGRQRDALIVLRDARTMLVEEIGVDPGPELRQLEADILSQSPALDITIEGNAPSAPPPRSPEPGADRAPTPTPTPERAATRPSSPGDGRLYVGRDAELASLCRSAEQAALGAGRPVVICGEPGIGKTRLVEELVARLPAHTVVAWGRCPESAAAAASYWPCIELGRQLEGAGVVEDSIGSLLPIDDVTPAPATDDPTADRLNLHVAVVKVLRSASRPLVLVFDDLQWADPASLRAIEFVAGELRTMHVLLVVTTRPVGSDAPPAYIDCLGELARQPGASRLDLDGLDAGDVCRWVESRVGRTPDPQVTELVHDRTAGNPFFVGEVVEWLLAEGRLGDLRAARTGSGVPGAVQDVVRRRVSRLPVETQRLLVAASVVGRTFDVDVLGAVTSTAVLDVLERLDPALAAGLVDETDLPGRFQFSHALVAETLEAEVGSSSRARFHAAAALAIATVRAADLDSHLAVLAHHALEGAAAGTAPQAYEWSVRAARHATVQLAHEDAAGHWVRAVRALELARPADSAARYEALFEQGLSWLRVDDIEAAYDALVAAIDLAIAMPDPTRVARAAAAMNIEGFWQAGELVMSSQKAVAALDRALVAMPAEPTAERALALGALADNAYWLRPEDELERLTGEAVRLAREVGDRAAEGRNLIKRNQALWRASGFAVRAAASDELMAMLSDGSAEPLPLELQAVAHYGAASVAWEAGEVPDAVDHVRRGQQLAARIGSPALITQLDLFASAQEAFAGKLDTAAQLCERSFELYRRTRRWAADAIYTGHRVLIWMEQGRFDEIVAAAPALLDTPYRPWFQEAYAVALVESGRLDAAADLVGGTVPPLVDCWLFLGVLSGAAWVRVAIGDHESSAILADQLRPYAGRLATAGTGPAFADVHFTLAAVAWQSGDEAEARHRIDASIALLARAGAGPALVRALMLRAEIAPEQAEADRDRIEALLTRLDLPFLRSRFAGS